MDVKNALKAGFKASEAMFIQHLPGIAMGVGLLGMAGAVIMAPTAHVKALELKSQYYDKTYNEEEDSYEEIPKLELLKIDAKTYGPVAALFGLSAFLIIFGHKENIRRNVALAAAYKLSEEAFTEFKAGSLRTVGEKKTKEIIDNVARNSVANDKDIKQNVYVTGNGDILCKDDVTKIKFRSSHQKIQSAVNNINHQLNTDGRATLSDFYCELGVPLEDIGDVCERMGWDAITRGELLEVDISHVEIDNGEYCMVLQYRISPTYFYPYD